MKKLLSLLLVLCVGFMFMACGTDGNSNQQTVNKNEVEVSYDQELLDAMVSWINTAQPGTAGASLKAIYAAQEVLAWAQTSTVGDGVIVATVQQFFDECENEDEALEGFLNIHGVFQTLKTDDAQLLLDQVNLAVEDFAMDDEVAARIQCLFDAIA